MEVFARWRRLLTTKKKTPARFRGRRLEDRSLLPHQGSMWNVKLAPADTDEENDLLTFPWYVMVTV